MPSFPSYTITDSAELVWAEPEHKGPAAVHTLVGYGHSVDASYWSDSGSDLIEIDIAPTGLDEQVFGVGQGIPDLDGGPYVIVDVQEYEEGPDMRTRIIAAREDVHGRAAEELERAKASLRMRRRALNDPRLGQVKDLVRKAIGQTGPGWYSDVVLDEDDGELRVGGPTSMGFQTSLRQDNLVVLYRCMEDIDSGVLLDGRELHKVAVSAVEALLEREDELKEGAQTNAC